jgi:Alginate export
VEPGLRVDALAVRPVMDEAGWFEDTANPDQQLWGAYVTATPAALKDYAVDVYYFNNINHAVAFYASTRGPGSEHTSTSGGRFYGHIGGFDSTVETAVQIGTFNGRDVRAFAIHSEMGWAFKDAAGAPRLGVKADVLSGGGNPSGGTVHTFNALYPNYSYGTEAVLEAPSNLIDAGLDLHIYPNPALDFQYTGAGLWRYSAQDAFYAAPLIPLIPGNPGSQRHVGSEHQIAGNWRINPFVTMRATLVHYSVGQFVTDARGRDTNFAMLDVATRF